MWGLGEDSSTLKVAAASSHETSAYQTKRRHTPVDSNHNLNSISGSVAEYVYGTFI